MNWTDLYDVAMALEEGYPDIDILGLKFTALKAMVLDLEGFEGLPQHSNEKVLEAIQAAWLDERD